MKESPINTNIGSFGFTGVGTSTTSLLSAGLVGGLGRDLSTLERRIQTLLIKSK
jgi:hypothetical protein